VIHNRLFAECGVLDNFRGLCGPSTKTMTCKLVLDDPRGQGLSSFSRSTDVTPTDLVSAKGETKEVYCCDCDIVVFIVLF